MDPEPVPTWADWLCRPDSEGDPCDDNLDLTVVEADGRLEVIPHVDHPAPEADCFYVYPTTSLDPTPLSDLEPGPEEAFVVKSQAARYQQACRLFAPMYRQVTVSGLFSEAADFDLAYPDVLDAFRSFVAHDSGGRPFLLVGHSQGVTHLIRLLAEEIASDPGLSDRLVAAHLIGGFVTVPDGQDVGGSFAETPLCRSETQTGCVVHYNSYRADDPPGDDAVFARPPTEGMQIACTHPGSLSGGEAPLGTVLPADVPAEVALLVGPQVPPLTDGTPIETPFFSVPDLVHGACVVTPDASYLAVSVAADPEDPRADDIGGDLLPGWGLHLADVSLAQGDLVALAESQIAQWIEERP